MVDTQTHPFVMKVKRLVKLLRDNRYDTRLGLADETSDTMPVLRCSECNQLIDNGLTSEHLEHCIHLMTRIGQMSEEKFLIEFKRVKQTSQETLRNARFFKKSIENSERILRCIDDSRIASILKDERFKVYLDKTPRFTQTLTLPFHEKEEVHLLKFDFTRIVYSEIEEERKEEQRILEEAIKNKQFYEFFPGEPNTSTELHENSKAYLAKVFGGIDDIIEEDDTEEDIIKDLKKIKVATVICPDENAQLFAKDRINVVKEHEPTLPEGCTEAERGGELGSTPCSMVLPGIPKKKFSPKDHDTYADDPMGDKLWRTQAVYECGAEQNKRRDNKNCWIVYEGWEELNERTIASVADEVPETLSVARDRAAFLLKMRENSKTHGFRKLVDQCRFLTKRKKMGGHFWMYEDMTYFHTKFQEENRLPPVIYLGLRKDFTLEPPVFSFTAINVMDASLYQKWTSPEAIDRLVDSTLPPRKRTRRQVTCENGNGCVCNNRFDALYGDEDDVQQLHLKENCRLDFEEFSEDQKHIVIECSDICGCSSKCPGRAMQKSNQKTLVVYSGENDDGFGLRAAWSFSVGDYIGELTGRLLQNPKRPKRYQVPFEVMDSDLVLCTEEIGNMFRFMRQSPNPNALLVETFSRRFETDPLIPRIAVYAREDISFGMEITIA